MKSMMKLNMIALIIFFTATKILVAQNANEAAIKTVVNNLFDYSKSKSYEKAAALIAYDGEDKNRTGKVPFNVSNKDELNQVKRILKKISALLEISNKNEFGKFSETQIDGKDIISIEIIFYSNDQKIVETYSFIKNEKGFLLIK